MKLFICFIIRTCIQSLFPLNHFLFVCAFSLRSMMMMFIVMQFVRFFIYLFFWPFNFPVCYGLLFHSINSIFGSAAVKKRLLLTRWMKMMKNNNSSGPAPCTCLYVSESEQMYICTIPPPYISLTVTYTSKTTHSSCNVRMHLQLRL